ncbi:hypothetical protein CUT44_16055 [Streptomyces carminius]|uniref:Uncharacterized protein n=1 Tax=Streptomyces carminius TaxID=2665496 RepID=A0A2M8LXX9_9ACTN|nr:hypothetical protein [Streptomyces carminius]PJE96826.1 hypothetical protein CUT44_16055 [Streptomyces carminius]
MLSEEFNSQPELDGSPRNVHDFCLIYTDKSADLTDVAITFEITDSDRLGNPDDLDPDYSIYPMGRRTLSAEDKAVVYFECAGSEMNSSTDSPALIKSELRHRYDPAVKGQEAKEANMTVLHSAALAVARELKCEDDGGLPAEPVLTPKA